MCVICKGIGYDPATREPRAWPVPIAAGLFGDRDALAARRVSIDRRGARLPADWRF